jgi:hypothetical protein
MDSFRDMMQAGEAMAPIKQIAEPAVYAAAFMTPAGKLVLEDMYARYVNVTRAIPGQGTDAAFYREGMAQVVFDIVHNITQAQNGD